MSKAPTSPFHWSVGVWHVLSKPLPKVEIASTWELGISSSSSDGKVPSGETGEVEVDRSTSRGCWAGVACDKGSEEETGKWMGRTRTWTRRWMATDSVQWVRSQTSTNGNTPSKTERGEEGTPRGPTRTTGSKSQVRKCAGRNGNPWMLTKRVIDTKVKTTVDDGANG